MVIIKIMIISGSGGDVGFEPLIIMIYLIALIWLIFIMVIIKIMIISGSACRSG